MKSAGWTNESHDAYLNFLEASFVQQLNQFHSSIGLRSRCRDLSDQVCVCLIGVVITGGR